MSKLLNIIKKEAKRQKKVINLIPSENYVSRDVLAALASPMINKYAEGKAHHRYYFGNQVVDEMEDRIQDLVYKVFRIKKSDYGINLQAYSGSIANLAVYLALLKPGDSVLAMALGHGGHLSHGHNVSWTGKLFKFTHFGVGASGYINYEEVTRLAKVAKPKMIVIGASAYPRTIDFKKFRQIADNVNALLLADIAHIAGLVVGGAHPSPFPYADVATTTTQKTLRGPRGAIIISRKTNVQRLKLDELISDAIDKSIFPGLQGGPHMHTIAAMGVALEEAATPVFKKYIKQVINNAKVLANELSKHGFKIVSGGTDNHLILVDVTSLGLTGKEAGERLEKAGIIVNKNAIPDDTRKPWDPSGIRLGTPAVTTQGMKEKDMTAIAKRIAEILSSKS